MKNTRLKLSALLKLTDAALETKANFILTSMTGNTNFPSITTPALGVISDSIKAFSDSLMAAANRDKLKVALKNETRAELLSNLKILGNFVTLNGKGNRAVLISSGFDVPAEVSVTKSLGTPQNFSALPRANGGSAIVSMANLDGAVMYTCLYNIAAQTVNGWFPLFSKTGYFVVLGLTPGATYTFKIAIVRNAADTVYTDLITKKMV
jgi:hypothetical protein